MMAALDPAETLVLLGVTWRFEGDAWAAAFGGGRVIARPPQDALPRWCGELRYEDGSVQWVDRSARAADCPLGLLLPTLLLLGAAAVVQMPRDGFGMVTDVYVAWMDAVPACVGDA